MKKKWIGWWGGGAVVMLFLPWAATTLVHSNAGMAASFLLFFVIDPLYAVIAGCFAGKNVKAMWSVPAITAVLFLLGAWMFFEWGEGAFVRYAGAYLVIGTASMLLSSKSRA